MNDMDVALDIATAVMQPEGRGIPARGGQADPQREGRAPDPGDPPAAGPARQVGPKGTGSERGGHQIIAITSGKGGVGKSNIAAGLSILLAAPGVRVALVDADPGIGDLDVLLGVPRGPCLTDVLAGRRSLQQVLRELPCGVHLVAGSSGPTTTEGPDPLRQRQLLESLAQLRADHDLVILDCGSGLGQEVMGFCGIADHVLVTTVPEPTAVTDAYAMVKALVAMGSAARVSILVNQASDRNEAKRTYARIASVSRQFLSQPVYDAGYVLTDPKVPAAVRQRRPFVLAYPRSPASRCLMNLAAKLRPRELAERAVRKAGWLRRILEWLD